MEQPIAKTKSAVSLSIGCTFTSERRRSKTRKLLFASDDDFDRRYKATLQCHQNYMEGLQLVLKENERKMVKLLGSRNIPLWYQELTDKQCAFAEELHDAIADDLDEGTSHRSKRLIQAMGIYPLCPNTVLRESLILSRYNDIAFLWFMLELHYGKLRSKSARRQGYSINERLILSYIAHLDTMTTLRGLEQILAPAKHTVNVNKNRVCNDRQTIEPTHRHYSSPYLEPIKVHQSSSFVPQPKQLQLHANRFLGRYERYRDDDFAIPNERTRWFAKPSEPWDLFGQSRRSSQQSDKVEEPQIEDEPEPVRPTSVEQIVSRLLDDQIARMVVRTECCRALCQKHVALDVRRRKLLEMLQRHTPVEEDIVGQVQRQRAEWQLRESNVDNRRQIYGLLRQLMDDAVAMAFLTPSSECPECQENLEMHKDILQRRVCSCDALENNVCLQKHGGPKPKHHFFRLYCKSVPYHFDYTKILAVKEIHGASENPIKTAIRKALEVKGQDYTGSTEAIDRIAKDAWKEELQLWGDRFRQATTVTTPKQAPEDLLDVKFIETKDVEFLCKLLKHALAKLTENPLYVLATFPSVEKLPVLVAWMRERYDCPVTITERKTALLESQYFWNYLIPYATALRWPICADTGVQSKVNWNYKKPLERMGQQMMYKFHRQFKNVLVQEARLCWSSMTPYLSGVDRFRQIFLAYLPNCEPSLVPLFRPWQIYEKKRHPLKAVDSESWM